jgi:hypothetical protein
MTRRTQALASAGVLVIAGGVAAGIVLAFSGSSQAAPTKAEYFARVSKICAVYGPKLDAIAPPPDVSIPGEVVTPLKKVIPLLSAENTEMRALQTPDELAAPVARWLALKGRVLAKLQQALHAAEEPDISGTAVKYLQFLLLARRAATLGHTIGFPSICSAAS